MRYANAFCVLCLTLCAGCVSNLANVRTLASGIESVTNDTDTIAAADQAACTANIALQGEYKLLSAQFVPVPPPCEALKRALKQTLAENRALEAFAKAIGSLAADQFATTTDDSAKAKQTLTDLNVDTSVVTAVGALFALVETAALDGYRQRELKKILTDNVAEDLHVVVSAYQDLTQQYSAALDRQKSDIDLIGAAITHDFAKGEPLGVQEFKLRLAGLRQSVDDKAHAIGDFQQAISKLEPAFSAARTELDKPSAKEIYQDVKDFAAKVKDAHDKLKKAFG